MAAESLPEPLSITLRNVKQHRELTVDLSGRLIVLVGPNGVGKSTVLKALLGLGRLGKPLGTGVSFAERVAFAFNPFRTEPRSTGELSAAADAWASQPSSSLSVNFGGPVLTLKLGAEPASLDLQLSTEILVGPDREQVLAERSRSAWVQALRSAYLQPEFSKLAEPSPVTEAHLGNRGENLATAVAQLLLRFPDVHATLLGSLKQVIPGLTHVGVDSVTMRGANEPAYELELQFGNARVRPADVSEGTLIALAVLILATHSNVHLVLLDDIDRGLHPLAQKALVEQLRGVLAARPDLKIICTSHSPYLVEHFDASEVRVLGRKKNGDTVCKRLDQHPEWQKYKEHLDTGSYWASVGEEWVGQD